MATDLATIRTALLTRLQGLLTTADPAGPFAHVGEWVGRPAPNTLESDGLGLGPALYLALDSEGYEVDTESNLVGPMTFEGGSLWSVYVLLYDTREPDAIAAETGTGGIIPLLDAVTNHLAGFAIAGLIRGDTVHPAGLAHVYSRPGMTLYVVRLRCARSLDAVARTDDSDPDAGIAAGVHLIPPSGTVPASLDPFSELEA